MCKKYLILFPDESFLPAMAVEISYYSDEGYIGISTETVSKLKTQIDPLSYFEKLIETDVIRKLNETVFPVCFFVHNDPNKNVNPFCEIFMKRPQNIRGPIFIVMSDPRNNGYNDYFTNEDAIKVADFLKIKIKFVRKPGPEVCELGEICAHKAALLNREKILATKLTK